MNIKAKVVNLKGQNKITLTTNENIHSIEIQPKQNGYGSSVNGGELLFLALASCYCNDLYREAEKKGIEITSVEVTVEGNFNGIGEPATYIYYTAKVTASNSSEEEIKQLLEHTDKVAEIQNTLRKGIDIKLLY